MRFQKKSINSALLSSLVFLSFLAVFLLSLHFVCAAEANEAIQTITGINTENIPTNPEELNTATQGFVESQLMKLANSTSIVKMNVYFSTHQGFFKALFNKPYSFSGKFFWIIVVWIFLLLIFLDIYGMFNLRKYGLNFVLGLFSVWILGLINLISALAEFLTSMVLKPESFWFKLLAFIVILIVMALIIGFLKMFYKSSISAKEKGEVKATKKRSKRAEEIAKRAEEKAGEAAAVAASSKEEDEDISEEEKKEIEEEAKEAAEGLGEEG